MAFHILNGTPKGNNQHLCHTCRMATIVRGYSESQQYQVCQMIGALQPINRPVYKCSHYSDRRTPSLQAMEEIAWIIRTKNINRPAGFGQADANSGDTEVVFTEPDPDKNKGLPPCP